MIKQNIPKIYSGLNENPGYNTNMEPIVKPIIQKNVWTWKLSNKNLISFMQIIEPIPSPIASGNRNGI